MIHHKLEVNNKVHDILSRRVSLSISFQSEIIKFEFLKELYEEDEDFAKI